MPTADKIPPIVRTFTAQVSHEGRVTIPNTLRNLLGIEMGDYVTMYLVSVLRETGEPKPIDHLPKPTRTFTKLVMRDRRVNLPAPLKVSANIRKHDYVTLTIVNVLKRGDTNGDKPPED